jgi:hypothetical protein
MVVKVTKASAMVFAVMVLTAVFGLLASVHNVAHAQSADEQNIARVKVMSKSIGVKSGESLIQNGEKSPTPGRFYFNADSTSNPIAKDVLILLDDPDAIKTQSDLETYINGDRNKADKLTMYAEDINGVSTIQAIWNMTDEDWERNSTDSSENFIGAPQFFKDILATNGYRLYNKTTRDPDGNCDGALGCFKHNDGGYTGFHGYACYTGRWDHVNQILNKSSVKMSAYEPNGHLYEVNYFSSLTFGTSNAKSFDTVLFG